MYASVAKSASLSDNAIPPIVQVTVGSQTASALYDTGSSICLISEQFFESSNISKPLEASPLSILGVTGTPIKITGHCTIPIQFEGRTISHPFYVSEKPLAFDCDLIFGIDFIIRNQLIYNPENKVVTFLKPTCATTSSLRTSPRLSPRRRKRVRFLLGTTDEPKLPENPLISFKEEDAFIVDEETSHPLFVSQSVEVPAFSEMFVRMKLPRYMTPSDSPYFIQGHTEQALPGIQVARTISFVPKSYVLVRVANTTSYPILLRKNLRIAQFNPSAATMSSNAEQLTSEQTSASVETEQSQKLSPDDFQLDHIPEPYQSQLRDMLMRHSETFGKSLNDIKTTNVYEHHIELSDTTPAYKNPYRLPFAHRDIVKSEIDKLLASGIIEHAVSPYNAPIILVKKSSGGYRLVSDLRLLNQKIKDDRYPNSFAADAIDQLSGCTVFSSLDLLSSFHQVPLSPSSRPYTAFTANNQHFQYRSVPFGLKSSSAALNPALQIALSGLQGKDVFVYVDDVLIFSKDYPEHLQKLDKVLTRLEETRFVLRPAKCSFMQRQIKYLGHIIDEHGVRPDPFKIEAIQSFPRPKTVKEIRAFLGFANYYRRHIPRMSMLAAPLIHLTKKDVEFMWSEKCENGFQSIKQALLHYPVLRFPDFTKDFFLSTDASDFAISAVLEQQHGDDLHPVAYISRQLNKAERNYSTTEKECLAIYWAFENLRCYLVGHFTHVITDHLPLRGVFKATNPGGRLTRWSLKLAAYDFDVTYLPGRLNVKPDVLSRVKIDSQSKENFLGYVSATVFEHEGWTREKIKEEQRKDPALIPIIDQLSGNSTVRRDLQLHEPLSNYFLSSDDVLYHVSSQNIKTRPFVDQLVVPQPMKMSIIQKYHDTLWSGHLRFEKTLQKIRLSFFWKNMYSDVKKYVNSCHQCMERHAHKHIKRAPLQRTFCPEYPMHISSFDIVGPMKTSYRGNTHYLSWIDHFSRFPEAIPLSETNTEAVAKAFVEQIISRYGISKVLLSDRGSNFTSRLMQSICKLLGVKRILSSPRHPQANGRVERLHSTIGNILSHFVDSSQKNWDEVLPMALLAIRSSVNRSTGDTPAQIFTGRDLILPLDIDAQLPFDPFASIDSYRDLLHKHLSALHEVVRANNENSILSQEKSYPHQNDTPVIHEGMLVYLHNPQFKVGLTRKLQKVNRGPYRVLHLTSPVNARIQHLHNPGDVQLVHVNRLRKFVEDRPFDTIRPQSCDNDPDSRSVDKVTPSNKNGVSQPVTLPTESGTRANNRLVVDPEELQPEPQRRPEHFNDPMELDELWNVPVPVQAPDPVRPAAQYNLRPRDGLRAPVRYGS